MARASSARRDLFFVLLVVAALTVVAVAAWRLTRPAPDAASVAALDPQKVALGQQVYAANCSVCHGTDGQGQPGWRTQNADGTYPPPPHDATGHTWHHGDAFLYRTVREGGAFNEIPGFVSAMPAFGDRLSEQEIDAVITYLKSLWGPDERAWQQAVTLNELRR